MIQEHATPRSSTLTGIRSPVKHQQMFQGQSTTQQPAAATSVARVTFDVLLNKLVNININKLRDVGEWTLVAKLFVLGQTEKCVGSSEQVAVATLAPEIRLTISAKVELNTFGDLDSMVYYPVVLNLYDVETVTKDKKRQLTEERSELVGQCLIDMLPLILDAEDVISVLPVFTFGKSQAEGDDKSSAVSGLMSVLGESKVHLKVVPTSKPFIPLALMNTVNIALLKLDGCFQLPASFLSTSSTASNSTYGIVSSIPTTASNERHLVSANKNIQIQPESIESRATRWPAHHFYASDTVHMNKKQELTRVNAVEKNGKPSNLFVPACVEFRCVMSSDAAAALKTRLTATSLWPVEFCHLVIPEKHTGTKKKAAESSGASEEAMVSKHGIALIDASHLLEPGAKSVGGVYRIRPFHATTHMEKFKRKSMITEIFGSASIPVPSEGEKSLAPSGKKGPDVISATVAHRKSAVHVNAPIIDPNAPPPVSQDELDKQLYETHGTFISLSISLLKPLVPRKPKEAVEINLNHLNEPRRCLYPNDNGIFAAQEFRRQVTMLHELISTLMCVEVSHDGDWVTIAKNTEKELENSGEILKFIQPIRKWALQLARDRSYRLDNVSVDAVVDRLIDDLSAEVATALPPHLEAEPDTVQKSDPRLDLRILSLECSIEQQYPQAEEYLWKCAALVDAPLTAWIDLGLYQLMHKSYDDALRSFAQFFRLRSDNVDIHVLIGYVYFELEDTSKSQTFFDAATALRPNSPLAWMLKGLFYECLPTDATSAMPLLREQAYHKASVLLQLHENVINQRETGLKILQRTAGHELPQASKGISSVDAARKIMEDLLYPCPLLPLARNSAFAISEDSILFPPMTCLDLHDQKSARKRGRLTASQQDPFFYCLSYISTFRLYRFVTVCASKLTGAGLDGEAAYWRFTVQSLLERNRLHDAEEIVKGVVSNGEKHPTIFLLYGHICYLKNDLERAGYCYERALTDGVELYDKYGLLYRYALLSLRRKHYAKAKEVYFLATKVHETCRCWLGCAAASYMLHDTIAAEYALGRANEKSNEECRVFGYLSLLASAAHNPDQAEKNYKAALSAGLERFPELLAMLQRVQTGNKG